MDISTIAAQLTVFLGPVLPYLLKTGGKLACEVEDKVSSFMAESSWKLINSLWNRLLTVLDKDKTAKSDFESAVKDFEDAPENDVAQAALRFQLEKLLASNPVMVDKLAEDLKRLDDLSRNSPVFNIQNQSAGGSIMNIGRARDIVIGDKR